MIHIQKFTFNPFQENTFVLFDNTKEAVVIDPGCNSSAENKVLTDFIEEKELKVVKLLNTHCHIDHVFGNQFIKDKYGVQLHMHELDVPTLKAAKLAADMYQIKPFIESEPDVFISEKDTIEFGESSLEILFVPGHAPGHVAFLNRAQKFIISGDVLFNGSIGRYDFPGCSKEDLINSIRNVLYKLEDDVTVYTGHGPETTIGHEKEYNPLVSATLVAI
ncbi:MAG TPA: MBL fold hydrolase [Microscillaceae bacterium]|nr:MBL fold hydrolase [Microscillaceae bacterium]